MLIPNLLANQLATPDAQDCITPWEAACSFVTPWLNPATVLEPMPDSTVDGLWIPSRLLIPFTNGSVMLAFMKPTGLEKNSLTPLQNPSQRYCPIPAMTVDGLWMPNPAFTPFTNGSTTLVLIQVTTPLAASVMPLSMPSHTLPPHSSIFPLK